LASVIEAVKMKKVISRKPRSTKGVMSMCSFFVAGLFGVLFLESRISAMLYFITMMAD
jgi:hypothetical protein